MQKLTLAAFYLVSIVAAFLIGERAASTHITTTTITEEREEAISDSLANGDTENAANDKYSNIVASVSDGSVASDEVTVREAQYKKREEERKLQEKVARLEDLYKTLNNSYTQALSQLDNANRALTEAGIDIPDAITLEEVQKYVPAPFDQQIANSPNFVTDHFKKLHEAEDDLGWGIEMQTRISDFIVTHEYGSYLQLESVICREGTCEVRAFPDNLLQWREGILSDMAMQSWWDFNSSSSISGNFKDEAENAEDRSWFYLIVSGAKVN
ncbi:hypothetical protein [Brumicola blandensis]|uniref:Uncharacterized protein n=1 Tax=Brumicola blandensis TaxID=3075611 RepID=A0AAW8R4M7_9ALTE|nr:hypothetical protein [Alteromonas sp. W409]MDT0584162.1 hypothetical protein [Alteromonas sp. W409]